MSPGKSFEQPLDACPAEFATVRRTVAARLGIWGLGRISDDVTLCVTELLANVARHAASPECVLSLHHNSDHLRTAVRDTEAGLPVVKHPDDDAEDGRGMFLISTTADRWGVELTPGGGKEVWFELRTEGAS